MQYLFPNDFIFGTSTAATQIETAFEHDWQGYTTKDGFVFDRTTDQDRKSTRLNSSHTVISYAVFCLKKKKNAINVQPLKKNVTRFLIGRKSSTQRIYNDRCVN